MTNQKYETLKKTLRHVGKAVKYTLYAGIIYFACLTETQLISSLCSTKITSQTQLDKLVKIERKKIDPKNDCQINAKLSTKIEGRSYQLESGDYGLEIGGNKGVFGADVSTLDHELYHILGGDFENAKKLHSKFLKRIKYLFWYEPKATIYEATGLKL